MAKVSKCDSLPQESRMKLIAMISEGMPYAKISEIFDIPKTTIIDWASKNGLTKTPTEVKRKLVEQLVNRPTVGDGSEPDHFSDQSENKLGVDISTGNELIDRAAKEDERDMRLGLMAARIGLQVSALALKKMHQENKYHARESKIWSECVAINVTTIRKIRGLDDGNQAKDQIVRWIGEE